jgi:predicted nucleic acid-binding protein
MKRTYVDANVLIAAFRGEEPVSRRAMDVLDDSSRNFVVSDYLRLEVLPKPTFHKQHHEVDFMNEVFNGAAETLTTSPEVTGQAPALACKYDMTPIDALHIAMASLARVDEFVTIEKSTKPMCRVREIRVVSLHSESRED